MTTGTFTEFLSALLAFESGWDRDRYNTGAIQDWQLDQWAGGSVTTFFPTYASWGDLTDAEWETMAYRSMNSLGFVGFQFGEALLIDLGYYDDDVFYGAGASSNTWDGTWTGKNGVTSLDDFMTAQAQQVAIREAFGYNLTILEDGLANAGKSLADFIGTTATYTDANGATATVTLTLTGILAAAHLRGAYGTLNLLLNGGVSTDEYGTSILQYIAQFGGYDSPTTSEMIAYYEDRLTGDEGLGTPGGGGTDTGTGTGTDTGTGTGTGTDTGTATAGGFDNAQITEANADVVVTWAYGTHTTISAFDPTTDTIFISWVGADALEVTEQNGSVVISIPSNNQSVTLAGVALTDLSPGLINALDATARAELATLIADDGQSTGGGHTGGHTHMHVTVGLTTPGQVINGFMPGMGDVVEIAADVQAGDFAIFEESGDALGATVRIEITHNGVTTQTILTGVSLDALSIANFSISDQGVLNEVASALGSVVATPSGGYGLTYDSDGSNPAAITGATAQGGVSYQADSNADDIVGFDPARDALDFGGVSVHGMIVTKSQAGEIVIDSPWSEAAQIVQGVTYQDVTIDSFGVVGNEHFREDIGGVVSWEQGVGPRDSDTVYVRSHEYGVHEVIDGFDPTSMKISFLYFGTRERLTVQDSDAGLVISSLPTGQSLTLTGVTKAELIPGLVQFHFDQVMEDNLEAAFGFSQDDVTLVDRTVLLTPDAPAGATTDGYQTRTGDLTGSIFEDSQGGGSDSGGDGGATDGGTGSGNPGAPTGTIALGAGADVVDLFWDWGVTTQVTGFDPSEDTFDFHSLNASDVNVTESGGDLSFEVLNNGGHIVTLSNIQAEDLTMANLTADMWNPILDQNSALIQHLTALGFDPQA